MKIVLTDGKIVCWLFLLGLLVVPLVPVMALDFYPQGNIQLENDWNVLQAFGIETRDFNCVSCINPSDVNDIDKDDIESDINTFVDIGGDYMNGPLYIHGAGVWAESDSNFVNVGFTGKIFGDGSKLTGLSGGQSYPNVLPWADVNVANDLTINTTKDSNFSNVGVSGNAFMNNLYGNLIGVGTAPVSGQLITGSITGSNVTGANLSVTQQSVGGEVHSHVLDLDGTILGGGNQANDITILNMTGSASSPVSIRGVAMNFSGSGNYYPFAVKISSSGSGFESRLADLNFTNAATATDSKGLYNSGKIVAGAFLTDLWGSYTELTDYGTWGNEVFGHEVDISMEGTAGTPTAASAYGFKGNVDLTPALAVNGQVFNGTYSVANAAHQIYGLYLDNTSGTINEPAKKQVGVYVDNDADGTDSLWNRWALFNAGTDAMASKVFLGSDNVKTYWGNDTNNASIYYDGTNLNFDTNNVDANAGAYFSNWVSATDFFDRTNVFDSGKGTALSNIKPAAEHVKADGSIDHSTYYGYKQVEVTDYGNCHDELYKTEYCYTLKLPEDTKEGIKPETTCQEQRIANWKEQKEITEEQVKEYYRQECETKTVDAVSLSAQSALYEQALVELEQENQALKEAICRIAPEEEVCKTIRGEING